VRQQLVDAVTGEAIGAVEKGRGYEIGENQFLIVEDQEVEQARLARAPSPAASVSIVPSETPPMRPGKGATGAPASDDHGEDMEESVPAVRFAKPENTRTIEIDRFFPRAQIDARYFEKPYYIVPRDAVGQEAFAVIRDAMRNEDVAGLGRVILSSRERPILIEPMGNGLRGVTLRFNHEVRDATEYFDEVPNMKLPEEMLRLAEHIIETKAADFDPAVLEDHYRNAMVHILQKKQSRQVHKHPGRAQPSRENVISIMDALRRSIAEDPAAASKAGRRKSGPAKRSSARNRKTG
jgi:Ku protein